MEYISNSEKDTYRFGYEIGENVSGGELIGLEGDLGAGKTIFVKGFGDGLGLNDTTEIGSPTFKLVNLYKGRLKLYHLDLYRLTDPLEIIEIGLFDYITSDSVTIIEWADKLRGFDLEFTHYFNLRYIAENQRKIIYK